MQDVLDLLACSGINFLHDIKQTENYISITRKGMYSYLSESCKCCGKDSCKKGSKTIDEFKDTQIKLQEIADLCDMKLTCSNGIFYLYKDKSPFENSEECVKKFKKENPEYAKVKGAEHKNQTSICYDITDGNTTNNTLRKTLMLRYLKKELTNSNLINFLRYLKKNAYRKLKPNTLEKKVSELNITDKTLDCLKELKYLGWSDKNKIRYWQITKEGMKLV